MLQNVIFRANLKDNLGFNAYLSKFNKAMNDYVSENKNK